MFSDMSHPGTPGHCGAQYLEVANQSACRRALLSALHSYNREPLLSHHTQSSCVIKLPKPHTCIAGCMKVLSCVAGTADRPIRPELMPYLGQHVLRVGRVLRQSRGHMLLTGAAGSGHSSATRLAAFIACARLVEARRLWLCP
jgi:P-loop containing dynein motor region D4